MTSRPIRLLQLVHGYPPAIGGVEFAVRDLCEGLVRSGLEVTVFTTNGYTTANFQDHSLPTIPISEGEEANGVAIRRFPVENRWTPALRILQGLAWRARLPGNDRLRTWFHGPISPQMRSAAATFDADVICAASFPLNHMYYAFGRRRQVPTILIGAIHTEWPWGYDRPHLLRLVNRSFATVAFTEVEKAWLVAKGAPAELVHVIPLGIDPANHQATAGRFRYSMGMAAADFIVAYVGQQGAHKGIDTLIRAFPDLLASVPAARLVIAGSKTPYTSTLKGLAGELPAAASARLTLLDDLAEDAKADLLADCNVFASPSAFESFGITTLEAWAQSRPVVVGDGPSQREIVEDGRTGLLVPYGDATALVAAISRLARSPDLSRSLGAAGRARLLERYTVDKMVLRYLELISSAAGSRRRMSG